MDRNKMSMQNNIEHIRDMIDQGKMTVNEGNVQMVLDQRVRLVINSIPRDIRKALNAAVKSGTLGHKKKDGHKPECYYNPTFEYLANAERNRYEERIHRAVANVAGWK
ncbi:MAG: hypothetical protein ACRDBQ_08115 [Shewanella sp.]